MATAAENLATRRDTILAELAAMTLTKPDYSIDGQSVQWTAYRKGLYEELEQINELLSMYDPFEIATVVV